MASARWSFIRTGNTAAAGQIIAHETYEDVIRALEADDSIDPKRRISSSIMSSPDAGGAVPIDRHFSHKEKIDSEPNRRRLEDRKKRLHDSSA